MEQFVKELDANFVYDHHEEENGNLRVYVHSPKREVPCPYCGSSSSRIHSKYSRKFKDLPLNGKKVEIVVSGHKFYCLNPECNHRTFAETFAGLSRKERRTKRLTDAVLKAASETSSVKASVMLRESTTDIGKSTICTLLKSNRPTK